MARRASALLLPLLLAGCLYSFTGGGLPSHIRTVAVAQLENNSPEPLVDADVQRALQSELPRDLGVRLAEEDRADAVVRGTISAYDELAASVRPAQEENQVPVVQREVRITYTLEIYDRVQDQVIWSAQSQQVVGTFLPDQGETANEGKIRAIENLVQKVIEGAQSQW